ncbi:MAG: C40 family peptidase [Halofilum sp. (in: g-proteobacteria)]
MLALILLVAGCATGPQPTNVESGDGQATHRRAADIALSLRGSPYRFGANGPDAFDCSGLVQYAYERAGARVPRTTRAQFDAIDRRYLDQLEPGDLVFFRTNGIRVAHVGIFIGDDEFVHAPKSGSDVHISHLDRGYWRSRIIGAGSLTR